MNVSTLIKQYFASRIDELVIDVFDEKNIYGVYQRVIETLTHHVTIETTLLQQLRTDKEINPSDVVANRTNVAEQYNELFLKDNELEELW